MRPPLAFDPALRQAAFRNRPGHQRVAEFEDLLRDRLQERRPLLGAGGAIAVERGPGQVAGARDVVGRAAGEGGGPGPRRWPR